ncbi:MAG: tRNA epoxyqueuosine(34) reductase QueG [bacterium]|nr:tRNA epoxyqueuosine(34) reductase QueG [bacterium]
MSQTNSTDLRQWITEQAKSLGFAYIAFSPVQAPSPTIGHFDRWIAANLFGTMSYLPRGRNRRADPNQILPGAKWFISVAVNYSTVEIPASITTDPSRGQIARYAHGKDYHDWLLPPLLDLGKLLDAKWGVQSKAYVDTGAILERAVAADGGTGFIGKNTCLINPRAGSYLLLGELLTTADLPVPPDQPVGAITEVSMKAKPSCGSCTRCLQACPSDAILEPFVLDANRCISYLTIEYRGIIPEELRPKMKNWIFGCDECQTCCPWNRFAQPHRQPELSHDWEEWHPPLLSLIELDEKKFKERFADTPLLRPGRDAFLRNVAIALANWNSPEARDALQYLAYDTSPLVRAHLPRKLLSDDANG